MVLAGLLGGCVPSPLQVHGSGVATYSPRASVPSLPAAALRNIRNVDLRSTILAEPKVPEELRRILDRCAKCGLDNPIYIDFTRDGVDDVLVPLYNDKEQVGAVAFSVQANRVTLVMAVYGPQLFVDVVDAGSSTSSDRSDMMVSQSMYKKGDPQCCPSGDPLQRTYRWNGTRMTLMKTSGGGPGLKPAEGKTLVVT